MLDRERLRDHATERRAHQVCGVEPERVEQADGVGRHVGECVRGGDRTPERPSAHGRHDVEGAPAVDLARQADVPVVEADHPVAARREHGAELVVPEDHLRAQPHDEEERAPASGAENLVLELDAVGARARHDQRPRVSLAIRSRTAVGIT